MILPGGTQALVQDSKLLGYALNPDHPTGRHHAALFKNLLGITGPNFRVLKAAILGAAATTDATPGQPTPHGRKFEQRFPMTGPRGTYIVLAVWLIETGAHRPRLITCYPE